MQYFIGIVPPEEYKNKVIQFRSRWTNNTIDHTVEPHITLKAQGGLKPDEKWLRTVAEVCGRTEPFQLAIGQAELFGEDILFLSAQSKQLLALHRSLVEQIAPSAELIEQYFELGQFVPHLTLAKTGYGLTKTELSEMARLAENELQIPFTFDVNTIRVYRESKPNRYTKYVDVPLGIQY